MPPRRRTTASVSASTPGTGTASVSAATPDGTSGTASRPPLRRRPAAAPARSRSPRLGPSRLATPSRPRPGETREEHEARLPPRKQRNVTACLGYTVHYYIFMVYVVLVVVLFQNCIIIVEKVLNT